MVQYRQLAGLISVNLAAIRDDFRQFFSSNLLLRTDHDHRAPFKIIFPLSCTICFFEMAIFSILGLKYIKIVDCKV